MRGILWLIRGETVPAALQFPRFSRRGLVARPCTARLARVTATQQRKRLGDEFRG
jgi:hypothetical protein